MPLVYSIQRQQCGKGAQCSLYLSLDLHHYSGFSCYPSEQQEYPRSKLMRSVLWLLHFNFQQVDLQAILKAGIWCVGGTFTSFYLRDLSPQADSIRKTRQVVAGCSRADHRDFLLGYLILLLLVYFVSSGSCRSLSP